MMIAPMLATPLGGVMADHVRWRGNFVITAALAASMLLLCLRFLPETRRGQASKESLPVGLFAGCMRLFHSRAYLGFTAHNALSMSANTVFLVAAPLLLAQCYGLSSSVIGTICILGALAFAIGSFVSARLISQANGLSWALKASALAGAAGALAFGLALAGAWSVAAIVLPAAVISVANGLIGPTVQAGAVGALAGIQGIASGLLMFLSSAVTAAVIQLEARFADGSPLPLAAILALCCLGGALSLLAVPRR